MGEPNQVRQDKIEARYISPTAVILGDPEIGEGTWIGHFCIIDGSGGLKIGKNCDISSGVHIYTHSTHERCSLDGEKLMGEVEIGDNVFIGANSVILPGCYIGSHCIIGALTLLRPHTTISGWSLVTGVPGKVRRDLWKKE